LPAVVGEQLNSMRFPRENVAAYIVVQEAQAKHGRHKRRGMLTAVDSQTALQFSIARIEQLISSACSSELKYRPPFWKNSLPGFNRIASVAEHNDLPPVLIVIADI
jgi:hypothetical protein